MEKKSEEKNLQFAKWMYYLANMHKLTDEDYEKETDPMFRDLMDQCRISNLSPEELEEYHKSVEEYQKIVENDKNAGGWGIGITVFPDIETFQKYKEEERRDAEKVYAEKKDVKESQSKGESPEK